MADKIGKDGKAPNIVFLSDPGHRVIDRYGIWNPAGKGWPHPTTLVIDRQGIVRWKFVEVHYKVRPTYQQILEALAKLRCVAAEGREADDDLRASSRRCAAYR